MEGTGPGAYGYPAIDVLCEELLPGLGPPAPAAAYTLRTFSTILVVREEWALVDELAAALLQGELQIPSLAPVSM